LRKYANGAALETTMKRTLVLIIVAIVSCLALSVPAAQTSSDLTEVAFVANAEGGTVALVEVASRSIIGVLGINPARTERKGPGATNYAQDTDVSPDGRTMYVSRGYSLRSISPAEKCCGSGL
jgi:hypothetical protein